VHPRWKTPYVAILVQAALATAFLFVSVLGKGTTVEKAYLIILDTQLLIYFIPYVYLFVSFLLLRREPPAAETVRVPGGRPGAWAAGVSGLVVTVLAMVIATVPPDGDSNPLAFEAKVIGGALAFVGLGGVVYWRGRRRSVRSAS
jgi:glutamate:GABA antiporter